MVRQDSQVNTPETSTTQRPRSRKLVAIIAGTALVFVLAATGVYYVAFRSLSTTVSWAPSVSAMASGGDLTVSGQISPADSGRRVIVETAPTARGPWVRPLPTVTTDGQGRFAVTFKPQLTGSVAIRVVVDPAGRYLQATGPSKPVPHLTLRSISLKGGELARQAKASADPQPASVAGAAIFTGSWNSHGGQLVVRADRSVTLEYRVYVWCSDNPTPPCDQMKGDLIISGGQVKMHIVRVATANGRPIATAVVDATSDPKIPGGSHQGLELNGDVITRTNTGQRFCDTKASQAGACGA